MSITELPASGEKQRTPIVVRGNPSAPDTTPAQVLIHTKSALDESAVQEIIQTLSRLDGVSEIRFNPDKEHLIMVSYDPRTAGSSQLLAEVQALGHEAQLVGL